ncbi:CHAP domain-containing protein [Intrasporangium chromatireducens]|uniref:CHAP domain-containing protein n=1 Tax=Intrasporangium chromatireducens TaxID=1386088 RepID=UPI0004BB4118|nr:CHAP domain-containing protein [Intrasporangium chromatireducens]
MKLKSRDHRRGVVSTVLLAIGVLVAGLMANVPAARAAEWIVLCTGYDGCAAAGYPNAGYLAVSSTSYWSQYTGHNCTNYVAYRMVKNGMPTARPASLSGNASNWGPSFPMETTANPAVGSIAWWDTSFSTSGHVAYVERVVSSTEIIISEDNWGGDFRWRRVTLGGGLWPKGFIHLKDQGPTVAAPARTFQLAKPARILDTRTGLAAAKAPVPAGGALTVPVSGRAGLPSTGVGTVLLNINATAPAAAGYLTVHASGTTQPNSRELSYGAGVTVTKLVAARVGADGKVRIYTSARTDLSADVVGWSPVGGYVSGGAAVRVLDTRTGLAAPKARLAAGGTLNLVVTGKAGVPTSGAGSVLLDVSASAPSTGGWLTTWPTGAARPGAPQVRYETARASTGLVQARIGTGGAVSVHSTAQTDVMVDIVGWLPTTGDQVAVTPARILDSETGLAITKGRVAAGAAPLVKVAGRAGVPTSGVKAVVATVTAVAPTAAGYLTAYPSGTTEPAYASVKYAPGQTVVNTVVIPLGADGSIRVRAGSAAYLKVDVLGYVRA